MKVIHGESGVCEWSGTVKEFKSLGGKEAFECISKTAIKIERAHIHAKKSKDTTPDALLDKVSDVDDEYPYDENYRKLMIYEYEKDEINQFAFEQITKYYPLWKQNNILNSGDQSQINFMYNFINRVRDWSNGENPNPDDLEFIVP